MKDKIEENKKLIENNIKKGESVRARREMKISFRNSKFELEEWLKDYEKKQIRLKVRDIGEMK